MAKQRMMHFLRMVPALGVLGVLAMLAGCARDARYRVRFVSDPPGAPISVVRPAGMDRESKGAPGVKSLSFGPGTGPYMVEARPVGALEENFKPTRFEVRRGDVHFLPEMDGVRTYTIRLLEKEYVELPTYEVVYTPGRGVMALKTRRRAYESVVEDDAHPVEPIMALRDCDGVRGVALSSRGDRIAYAGFNVREELAPEPAESRRSTGRVPASPQHVEVRLVQIAESQIRAQMVRGTGRQAITPGRFIDLDPSFSADGQWILYSGNRDRFSFQDLYRQGAGGRTGVGVVTQDLGERSAFWPTEGAGGMVVFSVIGPGAGSLADADLCTKGGAAGYVSVLHKGVQPAVSPDGKRIAYIKRGDLFVCDVDGGQEIRLTSDADEIGAAYLGSLIDPGEWERFEKFERYWLFLAHSYPAWTPDGKWVLFTSMKNRDPQGRPSEDLAAMTVDGVREVRLTENPSADRRPMVSGDGKWLYFLSNRGKQWAVWRMAMAPELLPK